MKNNQLFPFERNRYYAGKLLTSADFQAEQLYMNNKRRFLNRILFGSGIVCGLNVVLLDDLSILVESGVAIDGAGREIVVDASVVRKISVLEGFDVLHSERAGLYIRYREEAVHDVYCGDIGTGGKEYERNRIDEGYELYVRDFGDVQDPGLSEQQGETLEDLILREKILDNADYTIWISMPCTVSKGHAVKMIVAIRKKSEKARELSFHARIQTPSLTNISGKHELEIGIEGLQLPEGQVLRKDYWLLVEHTDAEETTVLCRKEDMQFQVGGHEVEPGAGIHFKLHLSDQQPFALTVSEVGQASLDNSLRMADSGDVCIAVLQLLRTDISCLVSGVTEQGVKRYIITPGKAGQRQVLMAYFDGSRVNGGERRTSGDSVATQNGSRREELQLPMASGRLEIPLDVNMKKGDVCVSEEIMHGLGKGNVYVEVGMEYFGDRRNTIFGNPELFGIHECMQVETAVRVLNDKGSFQVAAKLLGEQKSIVLQLSWVAVKFVSAKDSDELQEEENRSIIPETPTVRMQAKESYYFNVSFHNLQPCRLSYELTEPGSGEITADGMYTAPAKEGVYEIYIYCTDMPKISTYVYAVVSRK